MRGKIKYSKYSILYHLTSFFLILFPVIMKWDPKKPSYFEGHTWKDSILVYLVPPDIRAKYQIWTQVVTRSRCPHIRSSLISGFLVPYQRGYRNLVNPLRQIFYSYSSARVSIHIHPPGFSFIFIRRGFHSYSSARVSIPIHPPPRFPFLFIRQDFHSYSSARVFIQIHPPGFLFLFLHQSFHSYSSARVSIYIHLPGFPWWVMKGKRIGTLSLKDQVFTTARF
jgi:hypothetical protein